MKSLFFLLLLPPIFIAWIFAVYDGDVDAQPLDPYVLFSGDCSFFDNQKLNDIFDESPAGSQLQNVASRVDWEFNNGGKWLQESRSCFWESSNINGLSLNIAARMLAPKTFDDGSIIPPFATEVDDFASIGTRFDCFRPADKAAILHTSNYGEGGIAMTWGLFAIHVHVVAELEDAPADINVRIDTELEAEWILAQHVLRRLEAYREITPSLILPSGEREKCFQA